MSTTKERIAEAALKVFSERGYDGATVGQIAKRSGITEGAIYRHYESKRELFLACLEPVVTGAGERLLTEVQRATDLKSTMRAAVAARFRLLEEHMDAFTILFTEAPRHPELAQMLWERVVRPEWQRSVPTVERLVAEGILPGKPSFPIAGLGMTSLIWSLLAFRRQPSSSITSDTEQLIDQVTDFVLYGLAGQPQGGSK